MFTKTQLVECHSSAIHNSPQMKTAQAAKKHKVDKNKRGILEQGNTQWE